MTHETYSIIRQILMVIMLLLGAHMLFMRLPEKIRASFYQKSLRFMGVAFLFVPISCFIYTDDNRFDQLPVIATAIGLTAYYASFVFMSLSFLMLLGRRFPRTVIAVAAALVLLFPVPMWCAITIGNSDVIDIAITASYSYFVIMVFLVSGVVLYFHAKALKNIENYYSEDLAICVKWVSKSIFMLVGLAIVCLMAPVFFTYSYPLRLVFMVYGVLCHLHIYCGYQRMFMNLTILTLKKDYKMNLITAVSQEVEERVALGSDVKLSINIHLSDWIERREYLKRNITINDVAKSVNTNRTYLSKYINSEYDCSFRVWITTLRVDEAKNLLLDEPNLSIGEIADLIGSASIESFTHTFTRYVGLAPSKWREQNLPPQSATKILDEK